MSEKTSNPFELRDLQEELVAFAQARDWEQFHTPKNLLLALVGEVGELTEIFQWLDEDEAREIASEADRIAVEDEIADVLIYLVRLAQVLGIDPLDAARSKMRKNEVKYPAPKQLG